MSSSTLSTVSTLSTLSEVQKSFITIACIRGSCDDLDDPFAKHIFQLYKDQIQTEHLFKWTQSKEHFVTRMKSIDELISESDFDQVVIIGCGMDSRFCRLFSSKPIKIFELDLPEVIQLREQLISSFSQHNEQNRVTIECDCTIFDSWFPQCKAKGFDPELKTCWIVEGFLMYLTDEQVHSLIKNCATQSGQGSKMIGSYVNEPLLNVANMSGLALGKEWKSYFQDPFTEWFEKLGWSLTHLYVPNDANKDAKCTIRWNNLYPESYTFQLAIKSN